MPVIDIMFVCTGNICRSPLAHRVFEKELAERGLQQAVSVESSGTGGWHVGEDADSRMRRTAARHGLTLHHPAQRLSRRDVQDTHLLFAMAESHYREIRSMLRDPADLEGRLYLFRQFDPALGTSLPVTVDRAPDVPDPYYGGPDGFEDVYTMVERTCRAIVDEMQAGRLP